MQLIISEQLKTSLIIIESACVMEKLRVNGEEMFSLTVYQTNIALVQ